MDITAYWYDPNIQPYTEHQKRLHTLEQYLFLAPMKYVVEKGFHQNIFISEQMKNLERNGSFPDGEMMTDQERSIRCELCYDMRIGMTARFAKDNGYDAFTSTLLLSRHQDHEAIKRSCQKMSDMNEVEFIYKDLRKHWKDSISISKELDLYRQPYCGCIFSEHERFGSKQ